MLQRAERRRRSDLVVAAAIVVALAVGTVLYAKLGPAANTTLVVADGPIPAAPPAAADVPTSLSELWRAPSPATTVPVAEGAVVVTGDNPPDGGIVAGREAMTGRVRWSYHRDLPLCAVGAAWQAPIAVFRKGEFCADVTTFEPDTGERDRQRNSNVRPNLRFADLGKLVGAIGADYLRYGATTWSRPWSTATTGRPSSRATSHIAAAGTSAPPVPPTGWWCWNAARRSRPTG